ncbi:MAG: class I SAM-dependent methyltransferase [Candidatus Eisenbacteria bacterium]
MLNQKNIERFRAVVSRIFSDAEGISAKDALRRYYGPLERPDLTLEYLRGVVDLLNLTTKSIDGMVVLDAGCGYGMMCMLLAILGAKEAHGIDIMEERLDVFKECLRNLKAGAVDLPVYPIVGNIMRSDYEDGKFDLVLSVEAISHYREPDLFFEESARILRPGGILLISDGNNGANPKIVSECKELWRRFEQGPTGRVGSHIIEEAYEDIRKDMIRDAYPEWSEEDITAVATRTSGMTRDEILKACRLKEEQGVMPDRTFKDDECPVHPGFGSVLERFHHPQELARRMEAFGFKTQVYSYFGGAGGNPAIRFANHILKAFTKYTIKYARGYRIVATKV